MTNQNQNNDDDRRGALQKLFDRMALTWRLVFDRRVNISAKFIPLVAVLYLLSPIDVVPDLLLPFGVMDDVGVAVLALEFFIRMAPNAVVEEHLRELQNRVVRQRGDEEDVIEGDFRVKEN